MVFKTLLAVWVTFLLAACQASRFPSAVEQPAAYQPRQGPYFRSVDYQWVGPRLSFHLDVAQTEVNNTVVPQAGLLYLPAGPGEAPRRLEEFYTSDYNSLNAYHQERLFWSPDGKRIAFVTYQPNPALKIMEADGSQIKTLLTMADPGIFQWPAWAPAGGQLAFYFSSDSEANGIYTINADGTALQRVSPPLSQF